MSEMQYTQSTDELPAVAELSELFAQAHWSLHRNRGDIGKLLVKTDIFVTVRQANNLVGFGRALSDGVFRALLDDIIVAQAHRGQGVGHMIVKSLMKQLPEIEEIYLHTDHDLGTFYNEFGFQPYDGLTMRIQSQGDFSDSV